jgi:hypothetical protein
MRFGYYHRLTAKQKKTYRSSDEVTVVAIPNAPALAPLVAALETALVSGKRLATAKAASTFALTLCQQLGAPPVLISVRLVRPAISGGELHGLYTFAEGKTTPTIEVWMKTAAQKRVVRFRTFFRTLVHELLHHLDVTVLTLEDSFHTEGFYKRESSVMRQLLPPPPKRPARPTTPERRVRPAPLQLGLFGPK